MSDDLDEQVATILGWMKEESPIPGYDWWLNGKRQMDHVPHYSTNWSLVEEMLEWLRKQGCGVEIYLARDKRRDVRIAANYQGKGAWFALEGRGQTVPEALCVLVPRVQTSREREAENV